MTLVIEVPRGYDLFSSVHSWVYPDIQPVPEITWDKGFGRVFTFDAIRVPILVLQRSLGDRLQVQCHSAEVSASDIRAKVRQVLGLGVDVKNALKHIADDPAICAIVPTAKGIRPYCADSVFEALIKSIVQQQISYRAANVLTMRMVTGLVTPSVFENRDLYSFPISSTIADAGKSRLSDFGLGFKTDYVYNICSAIDSGLLDVEQLSGKTAAEARETLKSFRGIGDWTIDALSISGLGDFSVFPSGDLGMRNLLGRLYNKGERMSQAQVVGKVESWGTDGPLVLYLLMCADVLGALGSLGRPKTHKRRPSEAQSES